MTTKANATKNITMIVIIMGATDVMVVMVVTVEMVAMEEMDAIVFAPITI
jgi:hypothetical protein